MTCDIAMNNTTITLIKHQTHCLIKVTVRDIPGQVKQESKMKGIFRHTTEFIIELSSHHH